MCAGCALLNVPICSTGVICSANIHEIVSVLAVTGGAGIGSLKMWRKNGKPKSEPKTPEPKKK